MPVLISNCMAWLETLLNQKQIAPVFIGQNMILKVKTGYFYTRQLVLIGFCAAYQLICHRQEAQIYLWPFGTGWRFSPLLP